MAGFVTAGWPWSPMVMFVFLNATATSEIDALSLHDALPIWAPAPPGPMGTLMFSTVWAGGNVRSPEVAEWKGTRLEARQAEVSYAVTGADETWPAWPPVVAGPPSTTGMTAVPTVASTVWSSM